jgi:membrane protease YdiL (CAAX protease family)
MAEEPSTSKTLSAVQTIALLVWTLLPTVAIWLGMYVKGSALWAYGLYHGVCLVPAIIFGRHLWLRSLRKPSSKEWLWLVAGSILFSLVTIVGYEWIGGSLLSDEQAIGLMKRQGWFGQLFWPISIYAVVVNPLVEELFWRGFVLNQLDKSRLPIKHFGIIWSSFAYAALHYPIFRLVLFPVYAEIGTFGLVVYGAFMAVIYRKTGSIITTALAHGLLTDMAALVLMIDLFRRHPNLM